MWQIDYLKADAKVELQVNTPVIFGGEFCFFDLTVFYIQ